MNQVARQALRGLKRPLSATRAISTSSPASAEPAPAPDHLECTVNGETVQVPKGSTVMQACDAAGIDIPRWAARCLAPHLSLFVEHQKPALVARAPHSCRCRGCCVSRDSMQHNPHLCHLTGSATVQVLLPPEAQHCRQLPHVLGRGELKGWLREHASPDQWCGCYSLLCKDIRAAAALTGPSTGGEESQACGVLCHACWPRHEDQD